MSVFVACWFAICGGLWVVFHCVCCVLVVYLAWLGFMVLLLGLLFVRFGFVEFVALLALFGVVDVCFAVILYLWFVVIVFELVVEYAFYVCCDLN